MTNGIAPVSPSGGRPELVVVAKSDAALRATPRALASAAPAVDTTSLQALLAQHNAVMRPLFGLSEDRLRVQAAAAAPSADADSDSGLKTTSAAHDLALFYHVAVEPQRMAELAAQLRAHDLVEGAYIKPAGEPPFAPDPRATLTLSAPSADEPPAS